MGQRDLNILNNPVKDIIGKDIYFFNDDLKVKSFNMWYPDS